MRKPGNKKGVALAVVLVFCTAIMGLVGVLLFNTRSRRGTFDININETRALLAAKAAVQMAVYKYRVLPSEYYRLHRIEELRRIGTLDAAGVLVLDMSKAFWNEDFDTAVPGSPAQVVKGLMDTNAGGSHEFRVESFSIISRESQGYIKDYIQIRAVGSFRDSQKILEEIIEVSVAN